MPGTGSTSASWSIPARGIAAPVHQHHDGSRPLERHSGRRHRLPPMRPRPSQSSVPSVPPKWCQAPPSFAPSERCLAPFHVVHSTSSSHLPRPSDSQLANSNGKSHIRRGSDLTSRKWCLAHFGRDQRNVCLAPFLRASEGDGEGGGAGVGGFEAEGEAVVRQDFLHHRQADALAVRLGREEGREQLLAHLRRDARAGVFDLQTQARLRPSELERSRCRGEPLPARTADGRCGAPWSIASIAFFTMFRSACSICTGSIAATAGSSSIAQCQAMPRASRSARTSPSMRRSTSHEIDRLPRRRRQAHDVGEAPHEQRSTAPCDRSQSAARARNPRGRRPSSCAL